MLNRTDGHFSGLAELVYGSDGDFSIIKPGAYVLCAETGKQIQLHHLTYWSEELQEAYIDAEAAFTRWKTVQNTK
ncbi:MAG: DUF2093 domain-containing protein [Robiginitomaculum sp.]|nr:DUF2093 domain-containing protein [Robiginitomaculum sp.]